MSLNKNTIFKEQIEEYAFAKRITVEEAFKIFELAIRSTLIDLKYPLKEPIVLIDRKTGEQSLYECKIIVERTTSRSSVAIENARKEVESGDAIVMKEDTKILSDKPEVGSLLLRKINMPHFDKKVLLKLPKMLVKWVRVLKNKKQYQIYKDQVGTLINGKTSYVDAKRNAIIEVEEGSAVLNREEMMKGEVPASLYSKETDNMNSINNKSFKAIISDVVRNDFGWQVFLSRKSNEFLKALIESEVEEVQSGKVIIKGVARFAGERAKILVHSTDRFFDPVGACVGVSGIRINAISKECNGERIDVIKWSDDEEKLIKNIFSPVQIKEIIFGETSTEIIVSQESLKNVIGFKGYNIRLASKLMNMHFEVFGDQDYQENKSVYIEEQSVKLQEMLETDEYLSKFLVLEGFETPFHIAESTIEDLMSMEGCDEDLAEELKKRADLCLSEIKSSLSIEDDLWNLDFINKGVTVELAKSEFKIKKLEDLAYMSKYDIMDAMQNKISEEKADMIVEKSRIAVGIIKV